MNGENVDFIKMYIEGAEVSALRGAKYTFENNDIKCSICAYCCEHSEMTRYYFHELSQDFSVCWQMTNFDFKSPDYVA